MRLSLSVCIVMVMLILGTIPADAQGIKTFIERLDAVEAQLKALNERQKELDSEQQKTISVNEKNILAIQKQLGEITPPAGVSNEKDNSGEITVQFDDLKEQIALVKNEVDKLDQNQVSPEIVAELRASISELKKELGFDDKGRDIPAAISEKALATEPPFELETGVDVGVFNKYVWRGILLTDDPVVQPSVTLATSTGFSLNVWGSADMTDVNENDKEINELDYTLDYSFTVKSMIVSTGIIHYTFPNTDYDSTTELFVGLSSELTGNASLAVYQDIGAVEGTYISFGHGASFPVGNLTSLDISGALGWGSRSNNNGYLGVARSAVTDVMIGVSAPFEIGGLVTVTPAITFSSIVNNEIRSTLNSDGIEKDILFYGITMSGAF